MTLLQILNVDLTLNYIAKYITMILNNNLKVYCRLAVLSEFLHISYIAIYQRTTTDTYYDKALKFFVYGKLNPNLQTSVTKCRARFNGKG